MLQDRDGLPTGGGTAVPWERDAALDCKRFLFWVCAAQKGKG